MRGYRAAVTLALAGLAACQDQRAAYTAAVAHAASRWEAACGVRPRPASVVLSDVRTMPCGVSSAAAGCTDQDGHVTLATRSSAPVAGLVLHELGHVLGAGHHHGPRVGVMTASLDDTRWRPCLTPDDLDAVGTCVWLRPECH